MKNLILTIAILFSAMQKTLAQTPILGTYQNSSIIASRNDSVLSSTVPNNTTKIVASTSPNFRGIIHTNPVSGTVYITNAYPAGQYIIKVKALNGSLSVTTTFGLTVLDPSCSQGLFTLAQDVSVGGGATSLAVGDFNGDGKQDIVTTNYDAHTISVRLGNGDGSFIGTSNLSVPSNPQSVAVGDFNGDGRQDIAVANWGTSNVSILLGDGSGGFGAITLVAVAANPTKVVLGDFNNDGQQDLATANRTTNTVSIRLGDGNGGFSGTTNISVGTASTGIALGDFNNDGNLDFATANATANTVSVRLGNGLGNFSGTTSIAVGTDPRSLSISDFNGDAKLDIVVANFASNNISILMGDGFGNFTNTASVAVGINPICVTLADFNGDGKTDLAAANAESNNISIRIGNGQGIFSGGSETAVGRYPYQLAVSDVNNDGRQDLVSANYFTTLVSVLVSRLANINVQGNNIDIANADMVPSPNDHTDFGTIINTPQSFTIQNTGSVAVNVSSIRISGMDSSMFIPSAMALPTSIPPGGSLSFSITFAPGSTGLKTAMVSIYNNDCNKPVYTFAIQGNTSVTAQPTLGNYGPVNIVKASGNATSTPSIAPANILSIAAIAPVSFKGSLRVDAATGIVYITNAHPAGTYNIRLKAFNGVVTTTANFVLTVGNGACSQGYFSNTPDINVQYGTNAVAVGDFNNDGKQDIAATNAGVFSLLGNGNGGFTQMPNAAGAAYSEAIAVGDFNNDGKQDIISCSGNVVSLNTGNGQGTFTPSVGVAVGNSPNRIVTGDFNNDGKLDFATCNYLSNDVSIRLGDGAGGFGALSTLVPFYNPKDIVVGDFNMDGNQDLAVANGTISIWLGNGIGGFALGSDITLGTDPSRIALGDFNGDGISDFVTCNTNNTLSVRLGNGTGGFTGSTNLVGQGPVGIVVGDFNGDGKQDFAFGNNNGYTISIRLGDGNGNFVRAIELPSVPGSNSGGLVVGDFNGDGKQDIASNASYSVIMRLGSIVLADLNIKGGLVDIADNQSSTSATDSTNFGNVSNRATRTFAMQNLGAVPLTIDTLSTTGANADRFDIVGISLPITLAAGALTNFTLRFIPTETGTKTAVVHIKSNDCDEADYDFAVKATGIAVVPTIGTYPAIATVLGGNTTMVPNITPTNTFAITASAPTNFQGVLKVDPFTGKLTVTNAQPAGTFVITIKAFHGYSFATTQVILVVNNPGCSQGLFAGGGEIAVKNNPRCVAIGDFDGDGNQDMAVANAVSNSISIRMGNGTGSFTGSTNIPVGNYPNSIAVTDLNGDGKQDLAISCGIDNLVAIMLGDGTGNFVALRNYVVGESPFCVAFGDFNGDGKQDIVAANSASSSVSVRLGDGTGAFAGTTEVSVGAGPWWVAVADFNNDGKQDFATANSENSSVSIRLGDGSGAFVAGPTLAVGSVPHSVTIADFNADGNQDIAVANQYSYNVSIFLGNGAGGFSAQSDVATQGWPYSVSVGDFNGDGKQDIAIPIYGGRNVAIRLGDGLGHFSGSNAILVGNGAVDVSPIFVALGDFNNDGRQDFATSNFANASVSIRLGSVNEIDVQGNNLSIASGDISADTLDHTSFGSLLAGNNITRTFTIRNTSLSGLLVRTIAIVGMDSASFARGGITLPITIAAGSSATFTINFLPTTQGIKNAKVIIGNDDCDEPFYEFAIQGAGSFDGYPFTTIPYISGNVSVSPLSASTNITGITVFSAPTFKGSFYADAVSGIVTITNAHPAGTYPVLVKRFTNNVLVDSSTFILTVNNALCSQSLFRTATNVGLGSSPQSVTVADLNADGRQDMMFANANDSISIRLANTSGGFDIVPAVMVGPNRTALAVGDFNADGKLDFATANYGSNTISIRLGDGTGAFTAATDVLVGNNPREVAIGDFNNDGRLDMAASNYGSNTVSVRLGDGTGLFVGTIEIAVGANPYAIVISDFNRDNKLDFLTANFGASTLSVRLGDGNGNFTGTTNIANSGVPHALETGDFNGDGKQDVIMVNKISNTVAVRLGDGAGGFGGAVSIAVGAAPQSVAVGDFNGDGKQDFVTGNFGNQTASIRLGNGTGGFTTGTNLLVGPNPTALAIGDLNQDGQQDIVVANTGYAAILMGSMNEINVKGNNVDIVSGDTIPSLLDRTDFGNVGSSSTQNFTLQNTGSGNLVVSAINITGTDVASFKLVGLSFPITIPAGKDTLLAIRFTPTTIGIKAALVTITNNDCNESIYNFSIRGNAMADSITLGNYPNTTIAFAGGNASVTPAALPVNLLTINAFANTTNFKGQLLVNPVTGVLSILDAHPAGTYIVSIVAKNSLSTQTQTCVLTVGSNPVCGAGLFTKAPNVAVGSVPYGAAVGDFNSDGKQDIITTLLGDTMVSIQLGNGLGGFNAAPPIKVDKSPQYVALADFNGDGKQDFAAVNYNNDYNAVNGVTIRLGDGLGGFSGNSFLTVGASPVMVAIGDFNQDGKPDIAVPNSLNAGTVSVRLGNGDGTFTNTTTVAVGSYPQHVSIGDFNGDGKQDMAVSNVFGNSISIRLGNGNGGFSAANDVTTSASPLSIGVGDFNRDGNQDLAVTVSNAVSVFLGNGSGAFVAAGSVSTGKTPYSVVLGDFNNDGKLDLATSNTGELTLSVRFGDGAGAFSGSYNIPLEQTPRSIAVGDFDNDGRLDLVIASPYRDSVLVRLGANNEIKVLGNNIEIVNNDNSPSLADHSNFGSVGNVVRTFTIQNAGPAVLNINNIKVSGIDSLLFKVGNIDFPFTMDSGSSVIFTIAFAPTSPGFKTASVTIGNDDCDESVYRFAIQGMALANAPVLGTYTAANILTAGGNAKIIPSSAPTDAASITAVAPTEFKGLLQVDPITGVVAITDARPAGSYIITLKAVNGFSSATTNFVLAVGNPGACQASFTTKINSSTGSSPMAAAVADFNGDGVQDLAVSNKVNGTVSIRLGNGTGAFVGTNDVPVGPNPYTLVVGDFNGDGKQDFATPVDTNKVAIRLGNGTGGFFAMPNVAVGKGPWELALGDFNGDGKQDFAVASYDSSSVSIRMGDGTGRFVGNVEIGVGAKPSALAIGDFNSDGNQDLAITNFADGTVSIRLGDGIGNFTWSTTVSVGTSPRGIAIGDFNSDGKQDLAVANNGNGTVSIRLGNGLGGFTGTSNINTGTGTLAVAVGDFNGDGKQDLAITNVNSGAIAIRIGDGAGNFSAITSLSADLGLYSVVVGDFNNDGKQDIAAPIYYNSTVSVYLGKGAEINLQGNNTDIPDGQVAAQVADSTDFGNVAVGNTVTHIYTIQNIGTDTLNVNTITLSGADASFFAIANIQLPYKIPPRTSKTFTVTFTPTGIGTKIVKVNIGNNDCNESVYDFTVQGATVGTSIWLGNTPDWNLATNWSNGVVPSSSTQVVVNNGVPFMPEVTDPNSVCYSLTLNTGATITIKSSGKLLISK